MVIRAIIDLALRNRVLVLLLAVLTCLVGVVVYRQMPKDIYPDLNAPLVNIITTCPGMAPEDVERQITRPVENLMNGSPHVTRVRSESTTGESVVTVEFEWGVDIYTARQIVTGKLDIADLPPEASDPAMGPVSSRMGEIFEFAVVGDGVDPMELRSVADWTIRYRLLGVDGVSFTINLGGFVRQYQVFLKPEMLRHHEITIAAVKEAIEDSNRNFSGGIITKKNQEFLIKGVGRIKSLEHIENTVITSRDGIPVCVKDVAEVKIGEQFSRGQAGFNGKDAVSVIVQKQYGGDTLNTIANVKNFLAQVKRDVPEGMEIVTYYDQSQLINSALEHMQISMVAGGVLVLAVILLFLLMALGGLAIGIGKMAGGSVIMVENIYKFHQSDRSGATPVELAGKGAKEIGSYLFSANVIIVLVFLPLLTLEGIGGRMFRPTVFAVVAALLGSLLVNITLIPALMSFSMTRRRGPRRENRLVALATGAYVGVLEAAFRLRAMIVPLGLIAPLAVAWVCYQHLGREFVPAMDEGSMIASTVMLPETSLEESVRTGKKVEELLLSFDEVVSVCRTTGSAEGSEHVHPVNHSHYIIQLKPRHERKRGHEELAEAMREKLDEMLGIAYIFEQPIENKMAEMLTGIEGEIALKVFGPELDVLDELTVEIGQVMNRVPGIADLQIEQTTGIPLVLVEPDQAALSRYGIQVGQVADLVEAALNGVEVTDVIEADRITSVLLRLPKKYRENVDSIANLLVDTPSGHRIPLSQLARIDRGEGPQTIFHENLRKRKTILCNVVGRDIGRFVEEAKETILREVDLPNGYDIAFGGQFESQQKTTKQLTWMLLVVFLGVLVVLFASLGSFRQSVILLLNVPVTASGGIVALYLTGQTLNVSSWIGFIALFGIALQNGVILVGKINDLRTEGLRLHEAVIQGARQRFRPILMTELILILGVLPLAMGLMLVPAPAGEGIFGVIPLALEAASGAEIHRPLAVVYIGGFVIAIFFEQIVLPILYEIVAPRDDRQPTA